jgi:hypothetical protein
VTPQRWKPVPADRGARGIRIAKRYGRRSERTRDHWHTPAGGGESKATLARCRRRRRHHQLAHASLHTRCHHGGHKKGVGVIHLMNTTRFTGNPPYSIPSYSGGIGGAFGHSCDPQRAGAHERGLTADLSQNLTVRPPPRFAGRVTSACAACAASFEIGSGGGIHGMRGHLAAQLGD